MKKKLLSVLMAGALVATSSVNAFADTVINGSEERSHDAQITITGDVANQSGDVKPGTLNVTVPTSATFAVNEQNQFAGTNINVTNNGTQAIDVFAYEFIDTNNETGINVVKKSELNDKNRTHVSLHLRGSVGTAYFTTARDSQNRGVFSNEECSSYGDSSGVKIAKVYAGGNEALSLEGEAGQSEDTPVNNPERDTFTLRLKIAKSTEK